MKEFKLKTEGLLEFALLMVHDSKAEKAFQLNDLALYFFRDQPFTTVPYRQMQIEWILEATSPTNEKAVSVKKAG